MQNVVVFQQLQWSDAIVQWTMNSVFYDYSDANMELLDSSPSSSSSLCWMFPNVQLLKCNVDGSVWHSRETSRGRVIRDCDGNWVRAFSRRLGTSNPLLAELWDIRTTVDLIVQDSLPEVVVESDSTEAIEAILSRATLASPYLEMVDYI